MRILHVSDTHLGYSEYGKIDPRTGLNQREQDVYDAWRQVVEAAIALSPEVVVHAGDLFHTSRPTNRAIRVALEGIQRIIAAGIEVVMVSGNHSTPRIAATGSIFETIALFPGVHAAYSGTYKRFTVREVDFHCIPHCALSEELEAAFAAITVRPEARHNVLVVHGAWVGGQSYSMGEFNEQRIPDVEAVRGLSFDYIALGHYHRRISPKPHACYAGATERTSLNEWSNEPGVLLVDLETGERQVVPIVTRPMRKLPPLDCRELDVGQIYERLAALSKGVPEGAIVGLTLEHLRHDTLLQLDVRQIDGLFPQAFHMERQFLQESEEEGKLGEPMAIEALPVEFDRYIEGIDAADVDKERLRQMGQRYLASAF
ncbi:MAG: exonuclease SbcCD subunit D [candidate division KSB1 bacterium]|nr:exonuclease SbcCD subunit D [candidate division KSB1 bacterium]